MKKFAACFSLVLCLAILFTPFSLPAKAAESLNDLTKIYNNLSLYIVDSFFEDSPYYQPFKEELARVGELLKQENITQKDIDTYYESIKKAYSDMMKDTFDYSGLEILVKDYDSLSPEIFTPDSWRRLESILGTIHHELDAPSLFQVKKNATKEEYQATTNRHIAKFSEDYFEAYNALELIEFTPEEQTPENLKALMDYATVTAREDFLGNDPLWEEYEDTKQAAEAVSKMAFPSRERVKRNMDAFLEAYSKLCFSGLDYSPIEETFHRYGNLNQSDFSSASFLRYTNAVEELKKASEKTPFVYLGQAASPDECKSKIREHFDDLCSPSIEAEANLIPIERFTLLQTLCNENRNATSMEGLEVKLNRLLSRAKDGDAILSDPNATPAQVDSAIANLESAKKELDMAEYFLQEEQKKVTKQDLKTVRLIVLFTVLSLVLSVTFACLVSRAFYGKVDWRK